MVRRITPKERELRERIRKYHFGSLWADFDTTRDNIQETPIEKLEKRINLLGETLNILTNLEWRYEELTKETLPEDCSNILERFDDSYKRILDLYKNKFTNP